MRTLCVLLKSEQQASLCKRVAKGRASHDDKKTNAQKKYAWASRDEESDEALNP